MNIASLFNRRTLKPSWTFTSQGSIWRLLPTESGEFVGEARDQDKKQVSFFALDAQSGAPLWRDLRLDEPWWAGIEAASGGVVLLHRFATPDMPQHKGILALDLKSGAQLWENRELTFWFIRDDSVITHRAVFEKRVVVELDLRSGQVKRELDEDAGVTELGGRPGPGFGMDGSPVFPEILSADNTDAATTRLVHRRLPSRGIVGDVEYLVTAGHMVLNYHTISSHSDSDQALLDNHLKVLDAKSSGVVYEDVIAREVRGPVPDSFFLWKNTIYYIKNQHTLTAVKFSGDIEPTTESELKRRMP